MPLNAARDTVPHSAISCVLLFDNKYKELLWATKRPWPQTPPATPPTAPYLLSFSSSSSSTATLLLSGGGVTHHWQQIIHITWIVRGGGERANPVERGRGGGVCSPI